MDQEGGKADTRIQENSIPPSNLRNNLRNNPRNNLRLALATVSMSRLAFAYIIKSPSPCQGGVYLCPDQRFVQSIHTAIRAHRKWNSRPVPQISTVWRPESNPRAGKNRTETLGGVIELRGILG